MATPTSPTIRRAALALAAVLALVGCSSEQEAVLDDGPLPAAFDDGVPAPEGDVVLTIAAGDATPDWDLATLGELEQHELTIVEPFLDEEVTFTGPLWSDVLRASGIDLEATTSVELVALDDFVADIPTDATTLDGLLLATAADGQPIDIADGGPIRLVYPDGNPTGENLNNWIWSVRSAAAS